MTTTLDILRKAEEAVERATEEAKRTRLEEDRKFIIASLSEDIVNIMRPLMGQMLEGYKTTIEQFMEAIKKISIEAPKVTVQVPDIKIPEIRMPEMKMPSIIIPPIKVPRPEVTVNVPEMKMPKMLPPEVRVNMPDYMKASLVGIDNRNPLPVILTDAKGNPYMASGGGTRVTNFSEKPYVMVSGGTTTTTAGSRVQISSCRSVLIKSRANNAGELVVVGGGDVVADSDSRVGIHLYPGEAISLNIDNIAKVWFDVTTTGDGVNWIYFQ